MLVWSTFFEFNPRRIPNGNWINNGKRRVKKVAKKKFRQSNYKNISHSDPKWTFREICLRKSQSIFKKFWHPPRYLKYFLLHEIGILLFSTKQSLLNKNTAQKAASERITTGTPESKTFRGCLLYDLSFNLAFVLFEIYFLHVKGSITE